MQSNPRSHAACLLSDQEISNWAAKLGGKTATDEVGRAEQENRLRLILISSFQEARNLYRMSTLAPNWPDFPARVDKALPKIARRLDAIRNDILELPGEITAALRVRFGNYDCALTALGALPVMLTDIAQSWHKPHSGQPSLRLEGEVVGLLIRGVEEFTGERFPSPRSIKRAAERTLVRLMMARLLPDLTDAQFETALRHWYKARGTGEYSSG